MNLALKRYTSVSNPGAFSGLNSFNKNNKKFKQEDSKLLLSQQEYYTRHKPYSKKFKRGKFYAPTINDTWQIDLIDVSSIKKKKYKQNFNYILTCIDVFSKKAWAEPMSHKYASDTTNAFKKILKTAESKPKRIYSDSGNEFMGSFKKLLNELDISQLFSKSINKASVVERFNRTIKEKMYRIFTFQHTNKYVNILSDLIESYNNSYHSSIKTTPNLVNKKNEKKIHDILFGDMFSPRFPVKIKYKIGEYVRKAITKKLFSKGYTPNWSDEKYIISNIIIRNPITYQIRSIEEKNETFILDKQFYGEELQRVSIKEYPYDTYVILDKKDELILVKKLNTSEKNNEIWMSNDFIDINENELKISHPESIKKKETFDKRFTRSQAK